MGLLRTPTGINPLATGNLSVTESLIATESLDVAGSCTQTGRAIS
jgi:hypothetical protein